MVPAFPACEIEMATFVNTHMMISAKETFHLSSWRFANLNFTVHGAMLPQFEELQCPR